MQGDLVAWPDDADVGADSDVLRRTHRCRSRSSTSLSIDRGLGCRRSALTACLRVRRTSPPCLPVSVMLPLVGVSKKEYEAIPLSVVAPERSVNVPPPPVGLPPTGAPLRSILRTTFPAAPPAASGRRQNHRHQHRNPGDQDYSTQHDRTPFCRLLLVSRFRLGQSRSSRDGSSRQASWRIPSSTPYLAATDDQPTDRASPCDIRELWPIRRSASAVADTLSLSWWSECPVAAFR